MDISEILNCKCCTDIFPEDISLAQPLYMALMLKYHPDKCSDPRAPEATAVINELYGKLKKAHVAQEKLFRCGSRAVEIKYLMELSQEYGMEYIGERNVYFLISNKFTDCFRSKVRPVFQGVSSPADTCSGRGVPAAGNSHLQHR